MNATTKMTMTRTQVRWLLLATMVVLVIALLLFAPASKMDTAQRVVKEIRDFQTAHNRLPDSLAEIREKEAAVHYQKLDDRSFKVWYEANSDETEVYDSVTDSWFRQP
jgi:Sec-independent protein translocase protein TatA